MQLDTKGEWHRIFLHTGDIDAIAARRTADPVAPAVNSNGALVTAALAQALDISRQLALKYRMSPLPPGILAIGLVANESSGAARALTAGISRDELFRLLVDAVLGTNLRGLDVVLPGLLSPAQPPPVPKHTAQHRPGDTQPRPSAPPAPSWAPVQSPPPPPVPSVPSAYGPDPPGMPPGPYIPVHDPYLIQYLEYRRRRRQRFFRIYIYVLLVILIVVAFTI